MKNLVHCHAGYQYPERPQEVYWRDSWLRVEAVINQWQDPEGFYFWVSVENGLKLEVTYKILEDAWGVIPLRY